MAHMIPPQPKEFDSKSDEGIVFNALKKLPDDYYVFHSVSATVVENNTIYEREIDFVIANAKKGILCIEAKNGSDIKYDGRYWRYTSGQKMEHDGPYNQIATAKRVIIAKIRDHKNEEVQELYKRCKVMHAVWFFRESEIDFSEIVRCGLPENADERFTMLAEDVINPTRKIADIFSLDLPVQKKYTAEETRLTEDEFQLLLDSVLCPAFNLIPSPHARDMMIADQMNQLLREQYRLLDFLEEQPDAVINGAAGTGKTMLAVEKARRHSVDGEKVIFLCYNKLLCEHLIEVHKNNPIKSYKKQFQNVDFMTISKLARKVTGNFIDFDGLHRWVEDCYGDLDKFGYRHVIVDEGQDFGLIDVKLGVDEEVAKRSCSIIDTMKYVVTESGGTFYLFYDKYQMIQGGSDAKYELLDCIQNCDCRLTLHCNCRNTKEIAKTSITTLRDSRNKAIKPVTACTWFEPVKPVMHLVQSESGKIAAINSILDKYVDDELEDIVILTPNTFEYCCLADRFSEDSDVNGSYCYYEYNGKKFRLTTCIKFKGLEADAIVMIDLDKQSFSGKRGLEFYVGSSRAKIRLDLVCNLSAADYYEVVHELDPNAPKKDDEARMRKILGNTFSTDVVIE
jgi:hypothetical protein